MKRLGIVWVALLATVALAGPTEWTNLDGCALVPNPYNDGDSFHVRQDGKEYIFRLYFVDTPEEDNEFAQRVNAQAAYFGVDEAQVIKIGDDARLFTQSELSNGFSVITRWQGAQGRSRLPRYYAFVRIGKKDLAQLLVEQGLARVYGTRATPPGGAEPEATRAKLLAAEDKAREHRRGAWEFSQQLDYEAARAKAEAAETRVVTSPRTVAAYTPDTPRQRLGSIARGTKVRILEEYPDGWVRVEYDNKDEPTQEAYCLRWDLSLPELPAADQHKRAEAAH